MEKHAARKFQLKPTTDDAYAKADQAQKDVEQKEKELEGLSGSYVRGLRKEVRTLDQKIEEKEKALTQLRSQTKSNQKAIEKGQDNIKTWMEDKAKLEKDDKEKEDKLSGLHENGQKVYERQQKYQSELDQLKKDVNGLEEKLTETKRTLVEAEKASVILSSRAEELAARVQRCDFRYRGSSGRRNRGEGREEKERTAESVPGLCAGRYDRQQS